MMKGLTEPLLELGSFQQVLNILLEEIHGQTCVYSDLK